MIGFEDIVFWHWWIAALVFLGLEMMAAAYFFLWIGASAAVVGVILLLVPDLSWEMQFSIWAMLSMVSVLAWWAYRKKTRPASNDEDLALNQRGKQYIGRTFTLEEPVVNGQGKISVDDSTWKIEAVSDMEIGAQVKVVSADSTILKVEAA